MCGFLLGSLLFIIFCALAISSVWWAALLPWILFVMLLQGFDE